MKKNIWILMIFVLHCNLIASLENWPLPGTENEFLERGIEGQNINLKCAGRLKNAAATWDFKACAKIKNFDCFDSKYEDFEYEWRTLPFNTSIITLKNVNKTDSGFYRCKQAATPLIYIYYTIKLEIFSYSNDEEELPKFLDNLPINVTVLKNSQAVFQCKVWSKRPATIWWVWQGSTAGALRHMGEWYAPVGGGEEASENVGSENERFVGTTTLAKFVIPRVTASHAGRYFCVAVNTKGFTNSSAYLQVITDEDSLSSRDFGYLYILFFLPFGLAIIPTIMWTCFICRKKSHSSIEEESIKNFEVFLKFPNSLSENNY